MKGQISIEFIVSIIIVSFIFLFVLFLFFNRAELNLNQSQSFQAQSIANKISSNITFLYLNDGNLKIVDYIDWSLNNKKIYFSNNFVEVEYDYNKFSDAFFFGKIENQVSDFNGTVIFEKINDVILVRYDD
jgi:hypothetical protein